MKYIILTGLALFTTATYASDLFSLDCQDWKTKEELGASITQIPYVKVGDDITYADEKQQMVFGASKDSLMYVKKDRDLVVAMTPQGLTFKKSKDLIAQKSMVNIYSSLTNFFSGAWNIGPEGNDIKSMDPSSKSKYIGVVCSQKHNCFLFDKTKKKYFLTDDKILAEAKRIFPTKDLEITLKSACELMQSEKIYAHLDQFVKNCGVTDPASYTPQEIKKACAKALELAQPLLK